MLVYTLRVVSHNAFCVVGAQLVSVKTNKGLLIAKQWWTLYLKMLKKFVWQKLSWGKNPPEHKSKLQVVKQPWETPVDYLTCNKWLWIIWISYLNRCHKPVARYKVARWFVCWTDSVANKPGETNQYMFPRSPQEGWVVGFVASLLRVLAWGIGSSSHGVFTGRVRILNPSGTVCFSCFRRTVWESGRSNSGTIGQWTFRNWCKV